MDKKLTIVQVLPDMDEGGVEGETSDLAIHLAEEGHRSIVISAAGRLVQPMIKSGVEHFDWPGIGNKNFSCLPYILKVRSLILKNNVDVLHLRSRLPAWVCWLAWKSIPKSKRPALITTFHGFYSINCYSAIMTKGQKVIAVSESIKKHILENYKTNPNNIDVVYGGVDTEKFSPANISKTKVEFYKDKFGITNHNTPVIILPGRITEWKGQDVFVSALALIKENDFLAICVGEIPDNRYSDDLKNKINTLGLQNKVILAGHCTDMPEVISIADIVVSASSTQAEAFGKIAIEAMSMAKPVIATKHGGSLETIVDGETGWLVKPNDTEDLARAINIALAMNKEPNEIGSSGREHVSSLFSVTAMCQNMTTIYNSMSQGRWN
ncbi:MAG: glycosyltransferase family 4 protein [Desulfotalea sp.]